MLLPSTSRRSSGVLWILLPSHTRFMANSSKAAMMKPTVGEMMRESMMSMAFADVDTLFQRLMADQGIGAAYPRMEPIRVWGAGCRNAEVPGSQVPDDGREQQGEHHDQTLGRVHAKQQIDGQQVNDGIGHPNPPSMTPAKLNRPEATTAI